MIVVYDSSFGLKSDFWNSFNFNGIWNMIFPLIHNQISFFKFLMKGFLVIYPITRTCILTLTVAVTNSIST